MTEKMAVPIFRKILSALFASGSLRTMEIYAKMQDEAKSSFYNAMRQLKNEGYIKAEVRLNNLAVYILTDKGVEVVKEYVKKSNAEDVISAIADSDRAEELLYGILASDVRKKTGIEADDAVYAAIVKKNYEQFLRKTREDLEVLSR
ncbi:hypothetical protein [Candidatus Methanoperedens nitratireducens]|uniref:Uncharacterized protein n=1 Tax=Candidatus Methanoperedens nitratireducens TaxID=1392998 RepID=A0A284VMW0_9EURY|nr:hypothetical protein [Candidatus Methanoperedens nitroreducens]SNQ60582.1 hypothetical protein MNV_1910005 [Candidatus Methanoperedens nitroreducens]